MPRVGRTNRRTTGVVRRNRVGTRRTRRIGQRRRLGRVNRLDRAKSALTNNRRRTRGGVYRRNFRFSRNLRLRKVFVGGLPKFVDNRRLYGLFRGEGRINGCRIIFDKMGISRGFGEIEFRDSRTAWRVIRKWNNTTYAGNVLRVEYRKRKKRINRNNNYNRGYGYGYNNGNNYRRRENNYDRSNRGYGNGNYGYRPRGARGSYGGGFGYRRGGNRY